MQYWLMKSEPDVWSIEQQKKAGLRGAPWDGVRNYQAAKNLKNMKNQLSNKLSDITSKKIDINFSTNQDLIGGLKIKIDDMLFDSSLKTKLENAKSKLIGV